MGNRDLPVYVVIATEKYGKYENKDNRKIQNNIKIAIGAKVTLILPNVILLSIKISNILLCVLII